VRVTKRPKKERRQKPDCGKLAIRRDHPRRRIEMKSCMVGGLQMIVLSFEFHQNRLTGSGAVGSRNLPIPIDLAIGLYNSLYYRTSREQLIKTTSFCYAIMLINGIGLSQCSTVVLSLHSCKDDQLSLCRMAKLGVSALRNPSTD